MKNKLRLIAVITLLMLAFLFTPSYAKEDKVTLDFSGADLVYVIKMIAKQCNCDCVIESSVKGTVNMYLKDVPLGDALGVILKTMGYDYKRVDNLIVVAPPKELAKIASNLYSGGGADTYQVIMLENANSSQIIETLISAVPGVSLKADERMNAVVVKGSAGAIKRVKDLISKLDVPATGAFSPEVQTKVFDLKYVKAEEIDPQIKSLLPGLDYQIDKRTNSLVVRGTKQIFDKVTEYLAKIDTALRQVSLEVRVLSLNKSASSTVGPIFGTGGTSASITTTFSEVFNNQWGATKGYQAPPTYIDFRFGSFFPFVRTPIALTYVLGALINTGAAEIVANPTVTTLNGKEANIVSSRKFRYPKYDSRTGQYTVESVDVGVEVKMLPTITEDGYIVLNVKPTLSDFIALVSGLFPWTNQREAEITVRIKDGEPVVIGGLRRKQITKTVNKIPLLGDMPIFGTMFKGTVTSKTDNEVVIIIIPRILPKI